MAWTGEGQAEAIVDALVAAGRYPGLDAGEITQLKADMAIAEQARIDYQKANVVVKTTLDTGLNPIFTGGVPVPTDGGAALQIAWKAATAAGIADDSTGTIE